MICSVCGAPWSVNTPPALPLYPRGLITHYCRGVRVVRLPSTVEEVALVGSSVGASRLASFPVAKRYLEMLLDVARVERESGCDVDEAQLRRLRILWGTLNVEEQKVVRTELALYRDVETLGGAVVAQCTLGQLDNLNASGAVGGRSSE